MKHFLTILFLFLSIFSMAQKTETFYDYNWKSTTAENARFFSTIEKTDSGWLRNDFYISELTLQMKGLYEDKDCKKKNGHFAYYHANKYPSAIGRFVNNKQEGVYVRYHSNGAMLDSAFYVQGRPVGHRLIWHRNGFLSDSIAHVNDSLDVQISWFDNGAPSAGGFLSGDKKQGKWKYYHRNGSLSGTEVYSKGKMISYEYINEDGNAQMDTSKAHIDAVFKGGEQAWRKYLERSLIWPEGYRITNATSVTIGIQFVIDEEGKVQDVEVVVPFKKEFDQIAVNTIRRSTKWSPAIRQNRKVKSLFRQSVTFQQPE